VRKAERLVFFGGGAKAKSRVASSANITADDSTLS
jgi:hypothetical protein